MSDANGLATITALSPEIVENEWNEARQKFVLDNFCGGAPLPDAMAFIETAMRRKLSPEAKQIYLINRRVKNKDTGKYEDRWTPQTGIDGFRIIAERTGRYAGSDEPVFEWATSTTLERATVTVYKMVQSQRCAFSATAYWEEYNPGQGLWGKMPRTMLAKCAEALALRKAFPEDLSGLYTDAEMDQSFVDAPHSVQASVSKERVDPETGEITASEPTPLPSTKADREQIRSARLERLLALGETERHQKRVGLSIAHRQANQGAKSDRRASVGRIGARNNRGRVRGSGPRHCRRAVIHDGRRRIFDASPPRDRQRPRTRP